MIIYKKKDKGTILKIIVSRIQIFLNKFTKFQLLFLIVLLTFLAGIFFQKRSIPSKIKDTFVASFEAVRIGYYRLTVFPQKKFHLDIKFKDLEKLKEKRNQALALGILITQETDFVPADLRYQDLTIPIKLRLKGDWLDHLKTNKWSLRVETKADKALLGMKRFSLQVPESRNNINEWLFFKALSDEGIISLYYDFVSVSINGERTGIYALEEHFSKEVLERHHRREGPILKFNEDEFWNTIQRFGGESRFEARKHLLNGLYFKSLIEPFQQKKLETSPAISEQFLLAASKLNAYRKEAITPDQVFDYDLWSTYFALVDIYGAEHGLSWINLRLYFNPLTAKFEPIPFDNLPGKTIESLSIHSQEAGPLSPLFSDQEFLKLYIQKLTRYSRKDYMGNYLSQSNEDITYFQKLLRQDDPSYTFSPAAFFENMDFVRQSLYPKQGIRIVSPSTHIITFFNAYNLLNFPVMVTAITDANGNDLLGSKEVILSPTGIFNPPNENILNLSFPINYEKETLSRITITYHILGLEESQTVGVQSLALPTYNPETTIPPSAVRFIQYDPLLNTYSIPAGNWTLNQLITIGKNTQLYISPGASINLINNGGIISYSPIKSDGNNNHGITFRSSDGSGLGVLILNAKKISYLNHTTFINLSHIEKQDYFTTSAVTFYQSPVEINSCVFSSNRSEDSLNIVGGSFDINDTQFAFASSDALDIDFSSGSITTSTFNQIGNDAVDFSGSTAKILDISIDGAGDKGISIGERSEVIVVNSEISNSNLGIASKDSSKVTIDGITFNNLLVGVAIYQKKPEFGPSYLNQKVVNLNRVKTPYLVEIGSILQLPLQVILGDQSNVGLRFQ